MEHRHIPSLENGVPLSKKEIIFRGEDSFLKDVWYGRCAVCGKFIRPPKLWYWLRNGLIYLFAVPFALVVGRMLANTTPDNVVRHYLFTIFNCMVMLVIATAESVKGCFGFAPPLHGFSQLRPLRSSSSAASGLLIPKLAF